MSDKQYIQDHEEKLRMAMIRSDVDGLNNLLASDLIFTNHLGQVMSKNDDLEAHRTGLLKIDEIKFSDQKIHMVENVAIVAVEALIVGSYAGKKSESKFRFTRIWKNSQNDGWQVIAAHSCVVA